MEVDSKDATRYDRYDIALESEVVTVETRIKPTNKGFAMLAKMGWVEGQPVGLSGDGTHFFVLNIFINSLHLFDVIPPLNHRPR
jgi:hypothetical protein